MAAVNKTKSNTSNGHKTSVLNGEKNNGNKVVYRDSINGKFDDKTNSAISEADQLTLRAWKKTFENRKKVA